MKVEVIRETKERISTLNITYRINNDNDYKYINDVNKIKDKFDSILSSFTIGTLRNKYKSESPVTRDLKLPFNGIARMGNNMNYTILRYYDSYEKDEAIMLVYDRKNRTINNYLDLEYAGVVLDEKFYKAFNRQISKNCNIDKFIPRISSYENIIKSFQNELNNNKITDENGKIIGYKNFEISIDDIDER